MSSLVVVKVVSLLNDKPILNSGVSRSLSGLSSLNLNGGGLVLGELSSNITLNSRNGRGGRSRPGLDGTSSISSSKSRSLESLDLLDVEILDDVGTAGRSGRHGTDRDPGHGRSTALEQR